MAVICTEFLISVKWVKRYVLYELLDFIIGGAY